MNRHDIMFSDSSLEIPLLATTTAGSAVAPSIEKYDITCYEKQSLCHQLYISSKEKLRQVGTDDHKSLRHEQANRPLPFDRTPEDQRFISFLDKLEQDIDYLFPNPQKEKDSGDHMHTAQAIGFFPGTNTPNSSINAETAAMNIAPTSMLSCGHRPILFDSRQASRVLTDGGMSKCLAGCHTFGATEQSYSVVGIEGREQEVEKQSDLHESPSQAQQLLGASTTANTNWSGLQPFVTFTSGDNLTGMGKKAPFLESSTDTYSNKTDITENRMNTTARAEPTPSSSCISRSKPPTNSVTSCPVRPLSAYNFFFSDERERIISGRDLDIYDDHKKHRLLLQHLTKDRSKRRVHRKTHGKINFTTLSRMIGQRWRNLEEDRKDFYRHIAAIDLERYKRETSLRNEEERSI